VLTKGSRSAADKEIITTDVINNGQVENSPLGWKGRCLSSSTPIGVIPGGILSGGFHFNLYA